MLIQALQGLLDGNGPDFVQGGDGSSSEQPSFLPFFFFFCELWEKGTFQFA